MKIQSLDAYLADDYYDCLGNKYPDCWIYAHKKSWLTARVDAFMYRLVRHREWGRERIG